MLREQLLGRQRAYERKLRDLSYERSALKTRVTNLDKALSELSGALCEIDHVLQDLNTQAAIEAAKAEAKEVLKNDG